MSRVLGSLLAESGKHKNAEVITIFVFPASATSDDALLSLSWIKPVLPQSYSANR